jgi:glycosyltransferase involved in cell wall biosynthesis
MPQSATLRFDPLAAEEIPPAEAQRSRRHRVLFLNRSYWPDAEATGQLLTELCEDLADSHDVMVIAGQPNDNPAGDAYRRRGTQFHRGVRIRRVWHTRFSKRSLRGRLLNYLSFLIAALWAAIWCRRPDVAVVETDPPLLCLIGWYLKRVRGVKLIVYLQDIHPDIAVALGKISNRWPTRLLRRLMHRSYRAADRIVVLSRDMLERVLGWDISPDRVVCIPNWTDTRHVRPMKSLNSFREQHSPDGQFTVMYSGNLGFCQRLEDVIAAAAQLCDRPDIQFLLVGGGSLERQLKEQVLDLGLSNVRFLPYQSKANLSESLSAADVHLVPLDPRIASCLMPSKLYGVLASGTPLVAIAPADCELSELTREHKIGVVAPPANPEALADAIRGLVKNSASVREMGTRARRLAETQFDRKQSTSRFDSVLRELEAGSGELEAGSGEPGAGTTDLGAKNTEPPPSPSSRLAALPSPLAAPCPTLAARRSMLP